MATGIFLLILAAGLAVTFHLRKREDFRSGMAFQLIGAIVSTVVAALGAPLLSRVFGTDATPPRIAIHQQTEINNPFAPEVPDVAPGSTQEPVSGVASETLRDREEPPTGLTSGGGDVGPGRQSAPGRSAGGLVVNTLGPAVPAASASMQENRPPGEPDLGLRYEMPPAWSEIDQASLEGAIAAELSQAHWTPPPLPGGHILFVSGAVQELEPTLGQIPTASVTLRWELRQAGSGRVLVQGGVRDVRGTGIDEPSARSTTFEQAAREITRNITSSH